MTPPESFWGEEPDVPAGPPVPVPPPDPLVPDPLVPEAGPELGRPSVVPQASNATIKENVRAETYPARRSESRTGTSSMRRYGAGIALAMTKT
jgi:hypothetical protein